MTTVLQSDKFSISFGRYWKRPLPVGLEPFMVTAQLPMCWLLSVSFTSST